MSKVAAGPKASNLQNAAGILSLIASGKATSRATLLEASGISRVTVTQRLTALFDAHLIRESEKTLPTGGRPTRTLAINEAAGFMLVGNIGETHIRLAAMDLEPRLLAECTLPFATTDAPKPTLDRIIGAFSDLIAGLGGRCGILCGVSLSLPTPVDFRRGRVVGPSVLHHEWDNFDIIEVLRGRFRVPILVENDVNLMTIFEHQYNFPEARDLFFVKVGTGIGSGIISDGKIFRGAQGAAGDIGHIQFESDHPPLCRCGKLGCVEARAAGWAIARDLRAMNIEAQTARDVIRLIEEQRPEAIMLIRTAGRTLGEVVSDVVSVLNPSLIVIGGTLANAGELLLSGIRELIYQRCLPLATRELEVVISKPNRDSALYGAAVLLRSHIFMIENIEEFILQYEESYAATHTAFS